MLNMVAACFSLCFLLFGSYSIAGTTYFIEDPSDMFGLEHQKVLLTCRLNSDVNNATIIWFHNKSPIPLVASEFEVKNDRVGRKTDSSISFHLLRHTQGEYHCNYSAPTNSVVVSKTANVRIAFLNDQFVLEPQDKIVSVGETVLLECIPPTGLPKPSIRWSKENETLSLNERMHVSKTGSLRIDRVSWKDAGVYVCNAESFAFRRSTGPALLTVRHRPYFVESPSSQSVPVYSAFELLCRAAGEPQPVIFWRREPALLNIPFERTRLSTNGALHFTQVRLEDAGDYICRAVSTAGVIEAIAHVDVVSPPRMLLTPPSSVAVKLGEKLELPCNADGSPSPDIRWLRPDIFSYYSSLITSPSDRIFVNLQGSLIIQSVRPVDASMYECRASSPVGLTRTLTSIEVVANPSIEPVRFGALSPPILIVDISQHSRDARLICEFPSSHPPHMSSTNPSTVARNSNNGYLITWRVNDEPLQNKAGLRNRSFIGPGGSLYIHNLNIYDQANYTCIIFNNKNQRYTTWIINLRLKTPSQSDTSSNPSDISHFPNTPSNLTLVAAGATWLKFKWIDPVSDDDKFGYKLSYLPISFPPDHALTHPKNAISQPIFDQWLSTMQLFPKTDGVILNLSPDTGYWVEIRKVNRFGISSGCLCSSVVYTSEHRTSQAITNDSFRSLLMPHESTLLHPGRTVDFQDLSSKFQSINFKDMLVRSLTATELMISWMTHSSPNILQQVNGFRIDVKPVPMSRCLVTASQYSHMDQQTIPSFAMYEGSSTAIVHCSLSSDYLFERVLSMSTATSLDPNGLASVNMTSLHPTSKSIIVPHRTTTTTHSKAVAISGGLLPFTCYELDITAFKDDQTYGRIWSSSSRPQLALTLDAPPSHAPILLTVDWLRESMSNHSSVQRISRSPHGLRIQWQSLDLHKAHGALIGYVIHLLANISGGSLSVKVPADVVQRDVYGLNPHLEYTIYLAGVTCRGEGVRGPGYQVRPKRHVSDDWIVSDISPPSEYANFPSWAYGVIVSVVLFWVILGAVIPLLHRRRSAKSRLHSKSHAMQFNFDHTESNGWMSCFHTTHKRHGRHCLSPDAVERHPNDDGIGISSKLTDTPNQVEMTYLFKYSINSHHTSSGSDRLGSGAEDHHRTPMGLSTSGSNSKSDRSTHKLPLCPKDELQADGEAEVYANSDPSIISGSLPPQNIPQTSANLRPTLPDSINIPFPVPPEQRVGDGAEYNQIQAMGNQHKADSVPPYASCTVAAKHLPIYHSPIMQGSRVHLGSHLQQVYEGSSDILMRGYYRPHAADNYNDSSMLTMNSYGSPTLNGESMVGAQQVAYRPATAHCPIPPPPTYPPPPLPANIRSIQDSSHALRVGTPSSSGCHTDHFINPYASDGLYAEQNTDSYHLTSHPPSSNMMMMRVSDGAVLMSPRDGMNQQLPSVVRTLVTATASPLSNGWHVQEDYALVNPSAFSHPTQSVHRTGGGSSDELSATSGLGSTGRTSDKEKPNRLHNTHGSSLSGSDFSSPVTQLKPINSPTQLSVSPIQLLHTPTASMDQSVTPLSLGGGGMELLSPGESAVHVNNQQHPHRYALLPGKSNGQMTNYTTDYRSASPLPPGTPFDRESVFDRRPHNPSNQCHVRNGAYPGLT